jgi:hypothetical protein
MTSPKFDSIIDTFSEEDLFFLRYQYRVYKEWNNDPRLAVVPGINPNVVGAKATSGIRSVDGTDQLRFQVGGGSPTPAAPFPVSTTDPKFMAPHYQERCHPSQSQTRGLDGAQQCVVTARRSRLMSEGG